MILVVDVQYSEDTAVVAGILFPDWESSDITRTLTKKVDNIAPYKPGKFYKRELPCILSLLEDINEPISTIIIDGYVVLGNEQTAGLGQYLFNALNERIPVIGVAKKFFENTPAECEILRGESEKPLYITSVGIDLDEAKQLIINMQGAFRIPTLLKKVDQLCREII